MYRYYGAPAVVFWEGGQPEHHFRAGEASEAQADPAATGAFTAPDWISWFAASDPQRDAQVAAMEAPNGMAPAAAATVMHHAEFNAHFSHPLPRNALRKLVKKIPKVVQPVTCEVCKMQLASVNDIRSHITGKNHKKNLEKLQDSITPKVADGAVGASTTPKVTCKVCKRWFTSVGAIRDHERDKHKNNLEKLEDSVTPKLAEPPNGAVGASTEPTAAAAIPDGVTPAVHKSPAANPEDLEAGAAEGELKICTVSNVVKKIPKVVQPVTCEVCKRQFTSVGAMRDHERAKHTKNLEKLPDLITHKLAEPPNGAVGASTEAAAAAVTDGVMPAVHPMKRKRSATTPEDLEAGAAEGELKICTVSATTPEDLEAGAAEGELKICTVSNVVKKIPKVVQPVTCEVCKRQFTSVGAMRDHERAKHTKNLEKLPDLITHKLAEPPNGAVGASTEAAAVTDGVMPAVHPMKRKRSATTPEDLEAKKRQVIEWGAAEGELKICTM